jgi:hypothetical protein
MYSNHVAKIPASWAYASGSSPGEVNGHETNGQPNDAAHANGSTNGLVDGVSTLPESFLEDKAVRTVYGLVPLKYALDWPVFASYDELAGCAAWMGGRIPTLEEARSVYTHVEALKKKEVEKKLSKTVPAVNG